MTEFRKLAERIGRDIDGWWNCCKHLPEKEAYFFKLWFEPTMKERRIYNHLLCSWMSEKTTSISEDNNLRILALLFAEQLWNDIKEGEMTNHCTPAQSLALKEIGFDMPTRDYYLHTGRLIETASCHDWSRDNFATSTIAAPTRSEVLQWAREKKGIDAWVIPMYDFDGNKQYMFIIHMYNDNLDYYPTHPEAENALVWKIIEIIKEKKA